MTRDRMKIGILGAGIGGLAAAAALSSVGVDVEVFDQTSRFKRVGAGIHMSPNATRVLMGLGVSREDVARLSYLREASRHRDAYSGELTADIILGDTAVRDYGVPYTLWHRGDLHAALARLVPVERVHREKRAVEVDAGDERVRVRFADGSDVVVDALIAADGVHSVVRDQLFKYDSPTFTGRVAYRTVLPLADIGVPELDPSCKWWGTDRHFVHYVVGDGTELAFTTSVPDADWDVESWSAAGDPERLRAEFDSFHPHVRAILGAVKSVNKWGIHSREPLESWVSGRVALLGDACHTMPPYMAQGAAMALEDAVVLSRAVSESLQAGHDVSDGFFAYQNARLARTAAVQRGAQSNTWGRYGWQADWVFGYDAFTTPLAPQEQSIA